jgi:hypothetical protein
MRSVTRMGHETTCFSMFLHMARRSPVPAQDRSINENTSDPPRLSRRVVPSTGRREP